MLKEKKIKQKIYYMYNYKNIHREKMQGKKMQKKTIVYFITVQTA